jgi:hypothetical protein
MRQRFEVQYEFGTTPIEKVIIPTQSRDQMPPILKALQHIFITPELNEKIFSILEEKVTSNINSRTGRPGMSLWEILVLAVIRLVRDADYDELQYMADTDSLLRGLLGVSKFGESKRTYALQTIKDNVGLVDAETINKINQIVVAHGHSLVKKDDDEKIEAKIDSYVFETNVHFSTDLNLLYDAARKVVELTSQLIEDTDLPGWRKSKDWKKRLKNCCRRVSKLASRKGRATEEKEQKLVEAAKEYLALASDVYDKAHETLLQLAQLRILYPERDKKFNDLLYFFGHLEKHIDLVRRRILNQETIPSEEKVYSLFEPHTEWINKGKAGNKVELGLKVAVATDQYGFILDHRVMIDEQDVHVTVPMAENLLQTYTLGSLSFDKGFWSKPNFETLKPQIEQLVLPKKGKLNQQEYEREHQKTFKALRNKHSAVESSINCLEHHGLNRCPDKGLDNFKKYTALGILACNLHKLGNVLLEQDRQSISKKQPLRKAA